MKEALGVFTVGPNGEVSLPPARCKELGINPDDAFEIHVEGDKIILTKV